jgi:hypothetical protein
MKWFDRQFDFNFDSATAADAVCHRLRHTPARLQQVLLHVPEEELNYKPGGKWSLKEHTGHLAILEALWRARLNDFLEQKDSLTPADLDNKATDEALFNQYSITSLLDRFLKERTATLALIGTLDIHDGSHTSLHPRLNKQMRIIDHLYFVAEHDDHHLSSVREMILQLHVG